MVFLKVRPGLQMALMGAPQINCHAWKSALENPFPCATDAVIAWLFLLIVIKCFFCFSFLPGSTRPAQETFVMPVSFWWKDGKNCQQDPKKTGITLVDLSYFFPAPKLTCLLLQSILRQRGGTAKSLGFAISHVLSLPNPSVSKTCLEYFLSLLDLRANCDCASHGWSRRLTYLVFPCSHNS